MVNWKKLPYLKYFIITILLVLIIETPILTCCTNYLNILGFLFILSAEWLVLQKKIGVLLLSFLVFINLLTSVPFIYGQYNPFPNSRVTKDNIIEVGKIAKSCLSGDETYISTDDAWRTQYYFGRSVLPSLEAEQITDQEAVEKFFNSELPYNIVLIHINNNSVLPDSIKELKESATTYYKFGRDELFIFKDCQ